MRGAGDPAVMSFDETLDQLLSGGDSLVRFGDGELTVLHGLDLHFQDHSPDLAGALADVLQSADDGLLICIPPIFSGMADFEPVTRKWWIKHLLRNEAAWRAATSPGRTYGNAFFSRPYIAYQNASRSDLEARFRRIMSLWVDRDVVIVEGEHTKFGVGNDLLGGTRAVVRITGPARNAFDEVESILAECLEADPGSLFLLSLGPAAKPLVRALHRSGRRAIDVGHLDMEYEWFLRAATHIQPVAGKQGH